MLKIRIDRYDRVPARNSEASQQRGLLAEITSEPNPLDPGIRGRKTLNSVKCLIATSIVYHNDFHLYLDGSQCIEHHPDGVRDTTRLVVRRNHDT